MAAALQSKDRGNRAFASKDYQQAIAEFTEAIALDKDNETKSVHIFYSNRSAAYLGVGDGTKALLDAEQCILLQSDWTKGYSRKGAALYHLQRYQDALLAYEQGLRLEPTNAALKEGKQLVLTRLQTTNTGSIKQFLMGDKQAIMRSVQFLIRSIAFAQFGLYLIPFQPSGFYPLVYSRFFQIFLIQFLTILVWTFGTPKWNQHYWMPIVQSPTFHFLFYCFLMWFSIPSILGFLPVVLVEGLHVASYIHHLFVVLQSPLLFYLEIWLNAIGAKVSSTWTSLTTKGKWNLLNRQIPALSIRLIVCIGIVSIIDLITFRGSLIMTLVYWQYLQFMYVVAPAFVQAFSDMDHYFVAMLTHPRCPRVLFTGYQKLKTLLKSRIEQAQNPSQQRPRCTIM